MSLDVFGEEVDLKAATFRSFLHHINCGHNIQKMLSILRKARLKDKEMRILMLYVLT